jgi:hypothetical protein
VCSTAFTSLGRAQAKALGYADLPIAVIPHPFGIRTRDEIRNCCASRARRTQSQRANRIPPAPS